MWITKESSSKIKTYVFLFVIFLTPISLRGQVAEIKLADQYVVNGEYEKALDLYKDLAKKKENIPRIHQSYFSLMTSRGDYDRSEKYINKAIKAYPYNVQFKIDKGFLYKAKGEDQKADKIYDDVLDFVQRKPAYIRNAANYFLKKRLNDYALKAYQIARTKQKNSVAFAIEIANIYRLLNEKEKMIKEYLNYLEDQPINYSYIKNTLQYYLNTSEDKNILRTQLIDRVQKRPNNTIYSKLLIWLNIQEKKFFRAFIQAKALDKRTKTEGRNTAEVAGIAFQNKDYKAATKIYEYLVENYSTSPMYYQYRNKLIKCREETIKKTYPIDTVQINTLIKQYQTLIDENKKGPVVLEAMSNQAHLFAFYLHNKEKAIDILNEVISSPYISKNMLSKSKLELGDIYLLINQPWESTLLYSQVEKDNKETLIGQEAKLRNAKLSFYKGDFLLAAEHLDILKMATTREIANDAMALSLLIKDNSFDSASNIVLKRYSDSELLIFQNQKDAALDSLNSIQKDYPDHTLTDEICYLLHTLYLEKGEFQKSLEQLKIIEEKYPVDILGDDALYQQGIIYQDYLNDKEQAKAIFVKFLKTYPGSIYVDDSRKRFRSLRGDNL